MNFKEKLRDNQELVNQEINKYIKKENLPEITLNEAIEYSLMSSAKRLRPTLIIETYKLFKNDYEKCLPFAVSMEMTHTFSLIHDDLPGIDNDDYRRGRLTIHKMYNEATAILAGDSLMNNSYRIIANEINNSENIDQMKKKIRVLNEFSCAIDEMIIGEYLDTECEGKEISKEKLDYIHNKKTASFFKYCVRTGAILAEASEEDIDNLTLYAEKIGLEFQIKDDILSEIGDSKIMGKPVGNDKAMNKITYVTKFGVEKAQEYLEKTTNEALRTLETYGNKAEFLKELAIYIKDRNH
ncbi:MAG: polyprenyl synthetase family protein [Clostridia bacterium]|nr:polyprenyl synthetase family protein [Clostridia bacterium]